MCTQSRSTAPSICLIEMIRRHHLVEIERVEELALATLPPPHYRPLRRIAVLSQRNHGLKRSLNESLQAGSHIGFSHSPFGHVLVSSLKSANPICYVASTGSVRVSSSAGARDVRDRAHGTLGVGYGVP